jgi:hypothetical protein
MSFHAAIGDARAAVTAGPVLAPSSADQLRLRPLSRPLPAPDHWLTGSMPVLPRLSQHPAAHPQNAEHHPAAIALRARRTQQNPLQAQPRAAV